MNRGSASPDTLTRLGAAYREAGRLDDARAMLERVRESSPEHPPAVLFLGLTYEDLERYDDARRLYSAYLETGESPALAERIGHRIHLVHRKQLEASVRQALAQEEERADRAPSPRTVAVFPFLYRGTEEDFRPLGRALAEFLVTDLSRTDRLTVLERMRMQLLLDEMALAESEYVNPRTAARSGRILGAGRLVQGLLSGDSRSLEAEATVVDVADPPERLRPTASASADPDDLFELEARLALDIYGEMGITLTPAERERVTRRPTQSLEALLAFGRGLVAEDSAHFARAAQHYREAASIDPEFSAAADRAEIASGISSALDLESAALSTLAIGEFYGRVADLRAFDAARAIRQPGFLVPTPWTRDAVAEVLGVEGLANRGTEFRIIIQPGGTIP